MAGKFVSPKAKESLMTDILVKLFVKDYKDVEKVSVRTAYGVLASGVGIFCNVLLTIAKMVIGILLHSVSVTADAFNNLSDAGSSIIGMIGVKMAEKPADKEHPFGHGRLEYIAALIVSFLVIEVGFWRITEINIDGFVGLAVSLVVMSAGFGIAKDTLEPLIGIPATWEDYEKIKHFVEKYAGIEGSHDLVIHNYGPGRSMAIIHAEVPNDVPIDVSHEIIDRIEREAMEQLGISLTIHMDPVETRNEEVLQAKHETEKAVEALDPRCSIHDFRMVNGEKQINLIFDFVIPREYSEEKGNELTLTLMDRLQHHNPKYQCVITLDRSYVEEQR